MSQPAYSYPFSIYPTWLKSLAAVSFFVLMLLSGATLAASFDCDKAHTSTEKSICATPGLSSMDELLASDYQHALDVVEDKEALIAAQRAWLKERDRCGEDSGCILSVYQKRLKELRLCDMRPTSLERFICNTDRLWFLGRKVEREYRKALEQADDKGALIGSQEAWMDTHNNCGEDYGCLDRSYRKRLLVLRGEDKPLTENIPKRPYVLEHGQGVEVCEAYQDNLNSQHTKVPWKCDRPINKALPGFEEQPKWRRDDATPNGNSVIGLYQQMSELLWERDVNPVIYHTVTEWPNWQGTPEQLSRAKEKYIRERLHLTIFDPPYITTLDIDNDGTPEPAYFEQPCGTSFGARLAVLTPDWRGIDREKTEKLMPHPPFNRAGRDVFRPVFDDEGWDIYAQKFGYKPLSDAWGSLYYDVFRYRGVTYIDKWWSRHPDFEGKPSMIASRLRVYQVTQDDTKEICRYKFRP